MDKEYSWFETENWMECFCLKPKWLQCTSICLSLKIFTIEKKKLKVYNVFKLFFMNFMIKIMILMINSNYFFLSRSPLIYIYFILIFAYFYQHFFQFADRYQQWITYPFTRAPLKYIQINNKNINTKYERMLSKITKLERRSWVWFTCTTKFSLKKY